MTATRTQPPLLATTERVRRRYDRIARLYDMLDGPMELGARLWRRTQWLRIRAEHVLEVGVGTEADASR
jgi:ubiquinone/menaquinone biosynthesis C-methylase UbiE